MSAVIQGPAAAGTLTGLARALVQQGKLRPDRAENFARKALHRGLGMEDRVGIIPMLLRAGSEQIDVCQCARCVRLQVRSPYAGRSA